MSRKRKSLDDPDYSWDDHESCKGLLDQLQSELQSRLQKIDQYVDERKLRIEQGEAASRAELEEASKRLDARELQVAQREKDVERETEKLQALRAEATKLFEDLVRQLPDIRARVQLAAGASNDANQSAACPSALPPLPRNAQPQQQPASAQRILPPNVTSAAQPHAGQRATGPRPEQARPPEHPQQVRRNMEDVWGPLFRGPSWLGPQTTPLQSPVPQPPDAPHWEQQRQHATTNDVRNVRAPGTVPTSRPGSESAAANGARPAQEPQWRQQLQQLQQQQSENLRKGWCPTPPRPLRAEAANSNGAPASAFAGVDILRGMQLPRQLQAGPRQNGGGPGSSAGPIGNGAPAGQTAERGLPSQTGRGRGRGGPAKTFVPAAKGRAPMDGGGGRYARRGRGRQTPGRGIARAETDGAADGDSLDEAVKMLRAQTEPGSAAHASGIHANGANRGAGGRPQLHPSVPAHPALQADAPALLSLLKEQNILQHMALLEPAAPDDDGSTDGGPSNAAQLTDLYGKVHSILARILTPLTGKRSSEREIDAADGVAAGAEATGGAAAAERRDRYTLCALQCLIEAAGKYGTSVAPVRWGWCRELQAFVFVFEAANRIVVEKPEYGNASYFFDLEQPLPVAAQVQRLVAVLSVPAVTRGALLADGAPDLAQGLPPADAAVLAAAGWTPQCGLRALLNFSGERIIHRNTRATSEAETWQLYRDKINKLLSQGAAAGRTFKPVTGAQT